MRMKNRAIILGLVLSSGISLSALAEVSANHVQALAATCAACHGTNGSNVKTNYSLVKSPKTLAGIDASFFVEQLQQFRSGERESTVMSRYAKGLSDAEIEALSVYFAGQSPMTPTLPKATLSKDHQHQ